MNDVVIWSLSVALASALGTIGVLVWIIRRYINFLESDN